jgi:hypothetical protein
LDQLVRQVHQVVAQQVLKGLLAHKDQLEFKALQVRKDQLEFKEILDLQVVKAFKVFKV